MELTVSRIIWLVLGVALAISVGLAIFYWGTSAFVKTDFMATITAYDNGRAEIMLKNTGTLDITSLKVRIIEADGSKLNKPAELTVKLADGSDFNKLKAGEEVQLICNDWTNGGTIKARNTLTFEIICGFANGKVVSHTYTIPIRS